MEQGIDCLCHSSESHPSAPNSCSLRHQVTAQQREGGPWPMPRAAGRFRAWTYKQDPRKAWSGAVHTRTKLAGNHPSPSATRPHHHSLLVASITSMTSPALKPSSWSSMVTWSHRASAHTTLPSLMSWRESQGQWVSEARLSYPAPAQQPWEGPGNCFTGKLSLPPGLQPCWDQGCALGMPTLPKLSEAARSELQHKMGLAVTHPFPVQPHLLQLC